MKRDRGTESGICNRCAGGVSGEEGIRRCAGGVVLTAVHEAGDAGQYFVGRVVGEQALEPVLQAPGAFLFLPGEGRGHALAEQVLGPLSHDSCVPAQCPVGCVAEGDVEEDLTVPVGVVRAQDVDGQQRVQPALQCMQGAAGAARAMDRHQPGTVRVRGQGHAAARMPEFAGGGGSGQGDLDGVVRRHGRAPCRARPVDPGRRAGAGRRAWMCS